ncbi:E3 ubiquitin-protein ligase PPP1R11 [Culicoides brevitarsis]|uniref:E3 ubiquitin-protein ligase PPP1R11 n=1 Tax=Culicoides brevitarsis TaxID=469753 RepID=UPI00307B7C8C
MASHIHPAESSSSVTVTQTVAPTDEADTSSEPVLRLRLQKPKNDKKVQWTTETVDNEDMNKKKSKCCCIYVKPRQFGESSSESEDECEHCFGHVELKRKNKKKPGDPGSSSNDGNNDEGPISN